MTSEVAVLRKENSATLTRNPNKHQKEFLFLEAMSRLAGDRGKATFYTVCFFRVIDDTLDGDRPLDPGFGSQLEYVESIKKQIASRDFSGQAEISVLAQKSFDLWQKKGIDIASMQSNFLNLLDTMTFDYWREKAKPVLSSRSLNLYHQNLYGSVTKIMLPAIGTRITQEMLGKYDLGRAKLFSTRDIEEDWARGIINVPSEVLEEAGLTPMSKVEELSLNPRILSWKKEELKESRSELKKTLSFLVKNGDWRAKVALLPYLFFMIRKSTAFLDQLKNTNP